MSQTQTGYNKRVAVVYFSAALLIVSVGVRMVGSLMSESGEGLTILDWIMIGGIGLEFIVLTMYAAFIWSSPDDTNSVQSQSMTSAYSEAVLKDLVEELRRTVQQVAKEEQAITVRTETGTKMFSDVAEELRKNQQLLSKVTDDISKVQVTLQQFLEGTIREQVRSEVEQILNGLINSKMHAKSSGR